MNKTKIDWCDSTFNPVTGCLHKCEYCYARSIAQRFGGWGYTPGMLRANAANEKTYIHPMKAYYGEAVETEHGIIAEIDAPFLTKDVRRASYPFGFTPTLHRYRLGEYKNKKGRNIFVCSMADLFGEWVPDEWIEEVFAACEQAPQHNYLFLTKNPDRYLELEKQKKLPWMDNFWFGTSVTKQEEPFSWFEEKKFHWFVSMEPLLERIEIADTNHMPEWIIIGAETGNRKSKVTPRREWIESIVKVCRERNVPVFMKSSLATIWGAPLIQEYPFERR